MENQVSINFDEFVNEVIRRYQVRYQPNKDIITRPARVSEYDYAIHESQFLEPLSEVLTHLEYDPGILKFTVLPSYLNVRINSQFLAWHVLQEIMRDGERFPVFTQEYYNIIVEHTSANPTGRLHIGRSRNSFIGDCLQRILRKLGYQVTVEYYINDLGKQAVLASECVLEDENVPENFSQIYSGLTQRYQTDTEYQKHVDEQLREMEHYHPGLAQYQKRFRELIDLLIIAELKQFRVYFDQFTSELDVVYRDKKNQVQLLLENPKFQKFFSSEPGTNYLEMKERFHDRAIVLRKSDGTSVYLSRDLVYNIERLERADKVITILGEDTKHHNEMLRLIMHRLGYERSNVPVYYNFVILKEGKMSTRRQNVVTLHDLYEKIVQYLRTNIKNQELSETTVASLAVSFIRLSILSRSSNRTVVFEFDKIFDPSSPESSFYPFYTYARCCGILRKKDLDVPIFKLPEALLTPTVEQLLRILNRYRDLLRDIGETHATHLLTRYLHELCVLVNQLYDQERVIGGPFEQELLTIIQSVVFTLNSIAKLLGIEFLENI